MLGSGISKHTGNSLSQGKEAGHDRGSLGGSAPGLSPLCLSSELALGVHVGKHQPLLTFPSPKEAAVSATQQLMDVGPENLRHAGTMLDGLSEERREGGSPEPRGWGPQKGRGM